MPKENPHVPPCGSGGAEERPQLESHCSETSSANQDPDRVLLIGSVAGDHDAWPCCPWATTVRAWSTALRCEVIIAQECKRWGCDVCGRKRATHLAKRIETAEPNRLITFTCWTLAYPTPREAYDKTRRALSELTKKVRKKYSEFEYVRVLERHKNGYPHYHCIVRSPYIPQRFLSELWAGLTMSPIVDVRQIKQRDKVYYYVMKYLAKQKYIPWTNRRVSWTRNFFPKNDWKPPDSLGLEQREWHDCHPADLAQTIEKGMALLPLSSNCWLLGKELEIVCHQLQRVKEKEESSDSQQRGIESPDAGAKSEQTPQNPCVVPTIDSPSPSGADAGRRRSDGGDNEAKAPIEGQKTFAEFIEETRVPVDKAARERRNLQMEKSDDHRRESEEENERENR